MKLAGYISGLIALAIACPADAKVTSLDVTFLLFTPDSPNTSIQLVTDQLTNVVLDKTLPFKFIIHGYKANAEEPWVAAIKDEYLKKGQYNVIAVDYRGPASDRLDIVFKNAIEVAKFVTLLITDLNKTLGVEYKNVHLIGHSLGAQISGFCGQRLEDNGNPLLGRITGLDAAGGPYVIAGPEDRLSPGDAIFVDVIHTDPLVGMASNIGDVDFYPNWNLRRQPGCWTREFRDALIPCSHCRAIYLFMETINSKGFISKSCSSYKNYKSGQCNENPEAVMGEDVDHSAQGAFYLTTNGKSPFARFGEI